MSGGLRAPRLRVTIESVPLVIQPADADIASFEPPARGELVTPITPSRTDLAEGVRRVQVVVAGWLFDARVEAAGRAELRERVARAAGEHQATASVTLRAQIPGRVVRVWVAAGDAVEGGQRLLAIEAMKMENEIRAPHAGVVTQVRVEPGARVERGDELLSLG